jgi:hypothetical protein
MGQCCSNFAPPVPMPEGFAEAVGGLVEQLHQYDTFVETYTKGMKEKAGKPFECEEVLDPATESGKRTLVEGETTEKEVQHAAFCASTGEAAKGHICEIVWNHFEEDVTKQASVLGWLSVIADDTAHEKMDEIVGGIFDDMRNKLAKKLKKDEGDTSHTRSSADELKHGGTDESENDETEIDGDYDGGGDMDNSGGGEY